MLAQSAQVNSAKDPSPPASADPRRRWAGGILPALQDITIWAITSALVIAGAEFGRQFIRPELGISFYQSLAWHDGYNYAHIATDGYSYTPGDASDVAFFPAYPLACRWLSRITGLSIIPVMLLVSNLFGALAFAVAGAYLRRRPQLEWHADSACSPAHLARVNALQYAMLSMGLLPATFFLRMAYTESMFLFLSVLTLYGIHRRWPLGALAVTVGLATAVRPVGVALLVPLSWYVVQSSDSKMASLRRLGLTLPLACWGLAGYVIFQAVEFHQPFAFAITQHYHRVRPFGTFTDEVLSLLSWEPIREAYNPGSPGYWQALGHVPSRLFSLDFMNPIYLCATAALIAIGAWKRLLTSYEILLALPLIAIPYFTRAYEMRMLSQARFMVVVFPAYIVLGHLLSRLPRMVACAILAFSGFLMGSLAALFAAGYWLI
jgi:hypothetical protein